MTLRLSWRWLYLLPILFIGLFYFYPLAAIFRVSFRDLDPGALFQPSTWAGSRIYANVLWFTFWQAALSTLITLTLALPGAYVFARYQFPGKALLRAAITIPFVLPTVVVAAAFLALLGPQGLLNQLLMAGFGLTEPPIDLVYSLEAILLAHVFYNYSLIVRLVSTFWQRLDPQLGEAAQMLGASPRQVFRQVTLPLLWPAISAAALLVFLFCFTSFGVILLLGGPRFATLEVEIYRQAVQIFNLPVAASLSLLQILFTFSLMILYTRTQARLAQPLRPTGVATSELPVRTPAARLMLGLNLLLMLGLLLSPLLALLWRSLNTTDGLSLRFYRELFINRRGSALFVPPVEAAGNSLGYAFLAMGLAVGLGIIAATMLSRRNVRWLRWLDPLFMLPLTTSAVTLGFGYLLSMNTPPLALRSSPWLIPIAHTLVGLPFVIRSVLPALRSLPPSLGEAAALLGAPPGRVWQHIDWPLLRRPILVGAVFAFTISMGEFGASLFIARPQTPTLPVAIYRYLSQPGALNYGQAMAMSSLLMLICALGFLLIERIRTGPEGEF